MSENVYWILEVAVQPGQVEAFKAMAQEMSAATKANEPGTLGYHWNAAADGTTFHIFEHYKDSASCMVHLGNFGKNFAARFMPLVKPVRFTVYGTPSDDVKKAIGGLGPVYTQPIDGFLR